MLAGKKVDAVIISMEDNSYLKLTGEYAEAFSKISNLYRVLLALAYAPPKEGEAYFNDGKSIKPLNEVVL